MVVVAARNEEGRIAATLSSLRAAMPGAELIVADDASADATAALARALGATVVSGDRSLGKGGNVTRAAAAAIERTVPSEPRTFLLCDADLGESAAQLKALVDAVDSGSCDIAIGAFERRVGGGFGVALGFARWAIERRCGYRAGAPISGQRALSARAMRAVHPFARGYGMEIGITVDAVRAGLRVEEVELDLEHRASGRSLAGFAHRARQLLDFGRVYRSRA